MGDDPGQPFFVKKTETSGKHAGLFFVEIYIKLTYNKKVFEGF